MAEAVEPRLDGWLVIDKPAGLTSSNVVVRVKRALGVKVGHAGTLDPLATGVLPLALVYILWIQNTGSTGSPGTVGVAANAFGSWVKRSFRDQTTTTGVNDQIFLAEKLERPVPFDVDGIAKIAVRG